MVQSNRGLALALVLVGAAAVVIMTVVGYTAFFVIDTGDGFTFKNVSPAMAPAILNGEWITARRLLGSRRDVGVRRGDLVVHLWPADPSKEFVKRLMGLPGDTLEMVDRKLMVNGRALAEPYAHYDEPEIDPVVSDFLWQKKYLVAQGADTTKYVASRDNWGPLVVPANQYFVLGDNRDNSLDSRYWGFLPREYLRARVRRIYLSRDSLGKVRWSRLGKLIQ